MDLVEHLGVEGTMGVAPFTAGWGAPVEMIGLVTSLTLATPINGCWCGHTCHWHDRQH